MGRGRPSAWGICASHSAWWWCRVAAPPTVPGFGALLAVFRGLTLRTTGEFMNATLAVLGLSGGELVLVLVVILVLFGARRIPEFAKGLGKGITEFKKASREVTDEIERAVEEPTPPPPPAPKATSNSTAENTSQPSAVPKA